MDKNIAIARPKVSVSMITYNHEKFIAQAIESVIKQKTDYAIEIVIGEDGSMDSTAEIINQYIEKYPTLIRARFNKTNIGMASNFIKTLEECSGKYIAVLEGDDYWTDENKLQIQVDYLEANESIFGCFHDAANVDEKNNIIKEKYYTSPQKLYNQKDALTILKGSYASCSLLFRSCVIDNLPDWFLKTPNDFTLDLLITQYGLLEYLPYNMSAYRIHQGGVWQGKDNISNIKGNMVRMLTLLNDPILNKAYKYELLSIINTFKKEIALEYAQRNSCKRIIYGVEWFVSSKNKDLKNFEILLGLIFFPRLYRKAAQIVKRMKKKP